MSVIFGIKENNRIIIAGDKRGSSIDGKTLSDDLDKVLMINDHARRSVRRCVYVLLADKQTFREKGSGQCEKEMCRYFSV